MDDDVVAMMTARKYICANLHRLVPTRTGASLQPSDESITAPALYLEAHDIDRIWTQSLICGATSEELTIGGGTCLAR